MRKTFLTKGFVRFSRGLAGAALIAAAIGITSCETHSNSDRNESIKVYADPIAKEPIDAGIVGVKGGLAKLYVDANIDFVATWEDDAATPWAKVVDYSSTDPQTGLRVITLKANRRSTTSSYYTRRTGMLILAASDGELNYNRIIPIHQGSTARVSNDFATLKYGKTDPRFTDGETPIDNWTTAQKNLGFTSTTIEGEEVAHCYGKNGYLKLGDDKGHGADLISPYTNTLRSDSLLMVSFRAVAFTDYMTGARDDNKITVEVLGGGVIRDFAQSEKDHDRPRSRLLRHFERGVPRRHVGGSRFPRLRRRHESQPDYGQHAGPHHLRLPHAELRRQQPHLPRQFLHPPSAEGRRGLLCRKQRQR